MNNDQLINYLRNSVVGVETKIPVSDGRFVTAINFDNAATTPPFVSVMQEINNFAPWYSSIHRGTGYKSRVSSKFYDDSRGIVLDFVKADPSYYTVIYLKNTTDAINKLAYRLYDKNKKSIILSTSMEHHSNDLPWRGKFLVEYIDIDNDGKLSLEDMERKLIKHKGSIRLVTITGTSNVTGYINPIHRAAQLAHKYGAKIMVDGAQLVPHRSVSMGSPISSDHIDYLAFSAHKMYAPFGIGVLIGPKDTFKTGEPDYKGGGTVKLVTPSSVIWDDPPEKDEAGTPNIMGVVALTAAIRTLNTIGMDKIEEHENNLVNYALRNLSTIKEVRLYGNTENSSGRVGIIPFNIKDIPHSAVASILSCEAGIAVRSGCFCAQPYIQKLLNVSQVQIKDYMKHPDAPRPGMVRLSFGLYNTFSEIDTLIDMIRKIIKYKSLYIRKYCPENNYTRIN